MYHHHLKDMVKDLIEAGLVDRDKHTEALTTMLKYWDDKIALTWITKDVIEYAKQLDMLISEESAIEILQGAFSRHDAQVGICWDTFDVWLTQEPKYQEESDCLKVEAASQEELPLMMNNLETEKGKEALRNRLAKGE